MYKIILPLLGFESVESADIIEQDEYFSTLVLNNEAQIKVHLVNINYINKFPLSFKIDETILEKLKVSKKEDFEIYFCLVIQNPIEESIVNLIAPVLINKKDKLLGQHVINDRVIKLFATLKETTTL
ncbi:hypothetical protein GCM10012288_15050 [Malaciobacter pacificus]|jgi:flagellar assembly factor FliW|uniref:Putative flagellin level sensor protein FliW n=1 Tax=Malaciobacter pacificus TaxID=1080223 RepID=A0A5C2HFZ4_9BACT|nr:flagellar assembly protein FliW [Malaciobacter pacificus]QEP35342.1 putative flagellin level sensor protein FliW [Malaciobacter pacificus]GGD41833.1 hypothetical protein GCM10012288_15050 [Malaciobacter pacificus]